MTMYSLRERGFEEVLLLVDKYREDIGITRLADITCLDNIGIPVYCSYRPKGLLLQANAGKGVSHAQAKCSAMMEALEYKHIEMISDSTPFQQGSQLGFARGDILTYDDLAVLPSRFYSCNTNINWILFDDLISGVKYLSPADMVYLSSRSYVSCHTNGLSSGNTNNESILHGIYELIERDAYAQILVNGKLDIANVGKSICLETIDDPQIYELIEKIKSSGSLLCLILLPSSVPVYSFWAVIINEYSVVPVGSFNIGLGCHPHPVVAASRAITEAAQSRLIYIHGNREDIRHKAVFAKGYNISSRIYHFFKNLKVHSFADVCAQESPCLAHSVDKSLSSVIEQLEKYGYSKIYTHILRDEALTFSVTKTVIPGMRCEARFL